MQAVKEFISVSLSVPAGKNKQPGGRQIQG